MSFQCQGNFHISSHVVDETPTVIEVSTPANIEMLRKVSEERGLPFDAGLTRMILPYIPPVRLIDFEGDTSPPDPGQTPERTQLAYGSSITLGRPQSGRRAHMPPGPPSFLDSTSST